MVNKKRLIEEINRLPEQALVDVEKYVFLQKLYYEEYESDMEYFNSIPGYVDSLIEAANEPLEDCVDESEVNW